MCRCLLLRLGEVFSAVMCRIFLTFFYGVQRFYVVRLAPYGEPRYDDIRPVVLVDRMMIIPASFI